MCGYTTSAGNTVPESRYALSAEAFADYVQKSVAGGKILTFTLKGKTLSSASFKAELNCQYTSYGTTVTSETISDSRSAN